MNRSIRICSETSSISKAYLSIEQKRGRLDSTSLMNTSKCLSQSSSSSSFFCLLDPIGLKRSTLLILILAGLTSTRSIVCSGALGFTLRWWSCLPASFLCGCQKSPQSHGNGLDNVVTIWVLLLVSGFLTTAPSSTVSTSILRKAIFWGLSASEEDEGDTASIEARPFSDGVTIFILFHSLTMPLERLRRSWIPTGHGVSPIWTQRWLVERHPVHSTRIRLLETQYQTTLLTCRPPSSLKNSSWIMWKIHRCVTPKLWTSLLSYCLTYRAVQICSRVLIHRAPSCGSRLWRKICNAIATGNSPVS